MWRYGVGALAGMLLVAAGILLFTGRAHVTTAPLALASAAVQTAPGAVQEAPLPEAPAALEKTREEKRFDRTDHNKDGTITREEMLQPRRKAFAKLDTNHDGVLQFDEWAIKTETKFATADADRSGTLTRAEFATTAMKRKAARPRCDCTKVQAPAAPPEGPED